MSRERKTADAVEILRQRYVVGKAEREASVQAERVNAHVARMIFELRTDAGLTQRQLADLVGTTQSAISRLEDADYEGHSLSMLQRIAGALNRRVSVRLVPRDPSESTRRFAFQILLRGLRRKAGLTIVELARRIDVEEGDLLELERAERAQPAPRTLHKLATYYRIPPRRLAALAGALSDASSEIDEQASRFAACSESFSRLTKEEREALDQFVRVLRDER
jgi:transcriptional regulator with XRE-family HTH domain